MSSELPFLAAPIANGVADVTITFDEVSSRPTNITPSGTRFSVETGRACLFYDEAAFEVRHGREVIIDPVPDTSDDRLRSLLEGPVLALLLHQRGLLVLHASAVAIAGAASIFLGASGAGKSSIAAALYARGHTLLSDDIVAVDVTAPPSLFAGPGRLKLWPDSADVLGVDQGAGRPLHPGITKRQRLCPPSPELPVRVDHVFFLGNALECSTTRLTPVDAFARLLRHSYVAPLFLESGMNQNHFRQCAGLAASGLCRGLDYPRILADLPVVAAFVEADCLNARAA